MRGGTLCRFERRVGALHRELEIARACFTYFGYDVAVVRTLDRLNSRAVAQFPCDLGPISLQHSSVLWVSVGNSPGVAGSFVVFFGNRRGARPTCKRKVLIKYRL